MIVKIIRICAALALVLALTGCGVSEAEHREVLAEKAALSQALKDAEKAQQEAIEAMRVEAEAAAEATRQEIEGLRGQIDKAKQDADAELNAIKAEFEEYKKKYRVSIRTNAKGMKLGRIATSAGKVYEEVVLNTVDAERVSFLHETGSTSLMLTDLEPELRERLGYDAAEISALEDAREIAHRNEGDPGAVISAAS